MRQELTCADFGADTTRCCGDCYTKDSTGFRKLIVLGPPGKVYQRDWLIPLDAYICCYHYNLARSKDWQWWYDKMISKGLKYLIMREDGGLDYVAMGLSQRDTDSQKSPSAVKGKTCKYCDNPIYQNTKMCRDCYLDRM